MITEADINQIIVLVAQTTALVLGSGALGVAVTPIISYIKVVLGLNEPGKKTLKTIIAILTSFGVGCLATFVVGHFIFTTIAGAIVSSVIIAITSFRFYNSVWRDSTTIKKIEGVY